MIKLRKPNTKDIEKAIKKGAKMVKGRQTTGSLFDLTDDDQLCACALGAAALGAGMLTLKEAKAVAEGDDRIKGGDTEIQIARSFPNGSFDLPGRLFNGVDDNGTSVSPKSFDSAIVDLNDDAEDTFEVIAKLAGQLQRLCMALNGQAKFKL